MKHLAALLLLLAACGAEADIEPKSGAWKYNGSTIVNNTCGENTPTDASGGYNLTVTGPGKFTVTDDDFMNPFECTYEGDSFSCPKRLAGSNKPEATIDATLLYNVSITGTIDSPREDLTDRLIGGAGKALLNAPVEVLSKSSELLLNPLLGKDAAKKPSEALKGATDAAEKGIDLLKGIGGGLLGK